MRPALERVEEVRADQLPGLDGGEGGPRQGEGGPVVARMVLV
jgi:hypothetical protein